MSVSACLRDVVPFFMQDCPLCGRSNRTVVKGVYWFEEKCELYPDIGYSFCNCKAIFYTRFENVKREAFNAFQHFENPLKELEKKYQEMEYGQVLKIVMPDVFFCDWSKDPYEFVHWNPRENHILWDKDSFCEEAEKIGFEILKADRNFNVDTDYPQTMEILLRKP